MVVCWFVSSLVAVLVYAAVDLVVTHGSVAKVDRCKGGRMESVSDLDRHKERFFFVLHTQGFGVLRIQIW